ncbi:hypothetical protein [Pedobacter sp. NJ-S-72]
MGWALCDGNEGRPNLTDRFVLGAGSRYAVSQTGGDENHEIKADELPPISIQAWRGNRTQDQSGNSKQTLASGDIGQGKVELLKIGNGQSFSIMPQFYSLAYIIKL